MNYLQQVQRGIDYIEEGLDGPIALDDVARVAGISQWHFMRIFKALTGDTLKRYIRFRRLARSVDALLTSDRRIIEIAMDAGYDSQAAYSRAFKAMFGMAPNQFRRRGRPSALVPKLRINEAYIRHLDSHVSLEPTFIEHPRRVMVGLCTEFTGVASDKNTIPETLPALWAEFMPRLAEIHDALPNAGYGVICQTAEHSEVLRYYAAAEVDPDEFDHDAPLPPGMVAVEIPASVYAHFWHRGRAEQVRHTVGYIYSTWLLGSQARHTYGPDVEIYGSEYRPDDESSVMEYAIPVTM